MARRPHSQCWGYSRTVPQRFSSSLRLDTGTDGVARNAARPDTPTLPTSPSWLWAHLGQRATLFPGSAAPVLSWSLVVKQHEVGPGNGAVLGKSRVGRGQPPQGLCLLSCRMVPVRPRCALPSPQTPYEAACRVSHIDFHCSQIHPTLGFL